VEADNRGGSRELTRYVLSLGYRRIAYIAGPEEVSTAQDRLVGFQEAMEEAGLKPVVVRHGNFTYESGYELAKAILETEKVEVVMCGNDLMAIGAIRAAENLGLRVPEDLGVTGFDHVPWSDLVRPGLTTVEVPVFQMGQKAVHQVLNRRGKNSLLPILLICGGSCLHS